MKISQRTDEMILTSEGRLLLLCCFYQSFFRSLLTHSVHHMRRAGSRGNLCIGTPWLSRVWHPTATQYGFFYCLFVQSDERLVFIENGVQFRSSTRIRRQRHLLLRFGISAATERLGHWLQINVDFTSEYGLICSLNHHYRGDRVVRTVLSRPRFNRRGEWDN